MRTPMHPPINLPMITVGKCSISDLGEVVFLSYTSAMMQKSAKISYTNFRVTPVLTKTSLAYITYIAFTNAVRRSCRSRSSAGAPAVFPTPEPEQNFVSRSRSYVFPAAAK